MRGKLGLDATPENKKADMQLIQELFSTMSNCATDFTSSFFLIYTF